MQINILTLFPEMFRPVFGESILGRATEKGLLSFDLYNIRDYSVNKHKKVDDYPFGGGAGMVLAADPIFRALSDMTPGRILYMSPRGRLLDQAFAEELGAEETVTILCGHYEGVDQRVLDHWEAEEVSIGDYILTGGEIPAMVLIDVMARMVPGVLGSEESHKEESIYSGLLEYPQYTKPREYEGLTVPEVLISGNHKLIHLWKLEQSLRITKEKRPDLFEAFVEGYEDDGRFTKEERKLIGGVIQDGRKG